MRRIRRLFFLAALGAIATACGRGGGDTLLIGVAGPLNKPTGHSMKLAAQMAVDEINAKGGIDGRRLELVLADDEGDASKAIEVARTLRANPRVIAVVGHVNSAASIKAATIYNAASGSSDSISGGPVLQISPASSSPALTGAGEWTFRVCPTDLEFSPVLANWAAQRLGRRKAAVLYANDDYGQGVAATFQDAFRRDGGEVVELDPYVPAGYTAENTLDPYVMRALRRGADALVIGGQAAEGVKIIAAARRLGFTGPIMGSDGLTGLKDAGPVAEGVYVTSAFLPDRNDPRAQQFVAAYKQRFGELPDHRGAMTYDVVYLLRDAIAKAGTGRREVRDYVAGVGSKSTPFAGVSGAISFDNNGDAQKKEVAVGVVHNGQLVTAAR